MKTLIEKAKKFMISKGITDNTEYTTNGIAGLLAEFAHQELKSLSTSEGKTKDEIRSKVAEVFESFDDMREADMDSFIDQIDDIYMTLQKPSQSQPEGVCEWKGEIIDNLNGQIEANKALIETAKIKRMPTTASNSKAMIRAYKYAIELIKRV